MMDSNKISKLYDAYYYQYCCGKPYERSTEWLNFFAQIADRIVNQIKPATVLDTGCGLGLLVEALRQRGVEAFGIDISEYAIQNVHPDVRPYCWVGNIADPFPRKYDLIVSIEVTEHMPPREAEQAIKNICQCSDDVLFSSTPFDYKEVTHFNVQLPEYWAGLFAQQSFFRDVDYDASFITPWAVRFRHSEEPLARLVQVYERKYFLLWKENVDLRNLATEMRQKLASSEESLNKLKSHLARQEQLGQTSPGQLAKSRRRRWFHKLRRLLGL